MGEYASETYDKYLPLLLYRLKEQFNHPPSGKANEDMLLFSDMYNLFIACYTYYN
ncbi:hypothetical protein UNSWDHB_1650 [Dehalobacter sp. UNSWDHB]|nr:hypothetical protein DCF50_p2231 [Dehalobacter sp. CF]EQB21026.1 hypothetical protein UNSWDHB_1650 [Dehalobacter sp. UNSWDHB]